MKILLDKLKLHLSNSEIYFSQFGSTVEISPKVIESRILPEPILEFDNEMAKIESNGLSCSTLKPNFNWTKVKLENLDVFVPSNKSIVHVFRFIKLLKVIAIKRAS